MKKSPNNRGGAPLFMIIFLLISTGLVERAHARDIKLPPQATVSGTVSDVDGLPLPGVHIQVESTKVGTISDLDGTFSIQAGAKDVLVFSIVGFKKLEVAIGGRQHLEVSLEQDVTQLEEVVLNAGYYTVSERERTGNISKVTAVEIERQPVSNPLATIQGRMTGVNIQQTSGLPGGGFQINIRGQNSIRSDGNDPLYIVDGVPFPSQSLSTSSTGGIFPPNGRLSPLNSINPNDIESIEVLKDADATSIYGSRGANGVVLITTKQGREGKTQFSLKISTGLGKVARKIDMMNTEQYLEMRREAYANDGISEYPASAYDVNGTWPKDKYTDWQKELIGGTAYRNDILASVSGGSVQTQFLVSGNFQRETTVFPGDFDYTRGTVHSNLNHRSLDQKFFLNLTANFSADKNNLFGIDLTSNALHLSPNSPDLYSENGELNWENSTWQNPLARNSEVKYSGMSSNLVSNLVLGYEFISGLELKTSFGYNSLGLKEDKISPSTRYNPAYGWGSEFSSLYHNQNTLQSWIIEPQINWNKSLAKGKIKVLLGATIQEQRQEQIVNYGSGFASDALIHTLSAAQTIEVPINDNTLYRYNAVYGRINYNWKDKYIINLTGRRDGSSRFGPGNRFSNFGAVGASWIFSEESFIKRQLPFLSFGKLRGSYGVTGNDQIGNYQFFDTYHITSTIYNGISGLRPSRLYNPNFGWEENNKLEGAFELGFLDNGIRLNLTHYRNRSSSQLVGLPLPGTTGFTSILTNLPATVQNTGWELELQTVNFDKKFHWSTSLNLTIPRNKLIAFPGLDGSTYRNRLVIGEPLNIQKVYNLTGVNPETGLYEFTDVNGDGIISSVEDRQTLVDLSPKYYGGVGNSLSIKGWQLDFLFQFAKQNGPISFGRPGAMSNQPTFILGRWQKAGDLSEFQRYTTGGDPNASISYYNFDNSNGAFMDASYIRLKNLALSYSLPAPQIGLTSTRVFLLAQNLFTFTKYRGLDPENQSTFNLPPLKMITAGIEITF